ncbi:MAG: tetratricopeptide repeat protein, partial [Candidatus Latescibacteria bacterium]|nr:tetratricopeptide repeat protein [Candidatus Latescibacterota bacterium]
LHNNEGVQLAEQGRLREAIRSFRQAVTLVPNFASAYFNMGRAHSQLKQFDDAVRAFGTAVQVRPGYVDAWYQLGIVFQTKGQFEKARKAYGTVRSLTTYSPNLLYRLGFVSLKLEDWEQTATYWEQLSDEYPDHPAVGQIQQYLPQVQFNLGTVKYQSGDLSLAEIAFDRAMSMQPGYAEAHYNMGLVYRDQKRLDEALAMFREAEKLNYDVRKVRGNIAGVYLLADSLDQAEEVYQSLGNEGSIDGYRGLVKIAMQKSELAKALAYGLTAVTNIPGGDSFKLLAFVYEHNAEGKRYGPGFDADKVILAYERGIEFNPKDVVLHFNLGIVQG